MAPQNQISSHPRPGQDDRSGAIAVLTAVLLVPLIGMLAFSIDVGYLLKKRAELQRSADAAALAAVQDLIPDPFGNQNLDAVRATLRSYTSSNVTDVAGFTVLDSDIKIGRFDPATVYSDFTILDDGVFDTVRVTLRRDGSANSPIPLLFGGIFGMVDSEVSATATAVLQKATTLRPGAGVLPFSIPESEWSCNEPGRNMEHLRQRQNGEWLWRRDPGQLGDVGLGDFLQLNGRHQLPGAQRTPTSPSRRALQRQSHSK